MNGKLKRMLVAITGVVMAASLVGCGQPAPTPALGPTPTPIVWTPTPAATPTPTPKPKALRLAHFSMPTHLLNVACLEFAKAVAERTRGGITISVYPSEQLFKAQEEYDAVVRGAVDMAIIFESYHVGIDPLFGVWGLPYLTPDAEKYLKALDAGAREEISKIHAKHNMKGLGWASCGSSYTLSTRPIRVPSDMKGLKIRSSSTPMSQWIQYNGGISVSMTASEVYLGLQRGTIEATIAGVDSFYTRSHYEVAKYLCRPSAGIEQPMPLVMNMDVWKSLSPEDQQIIATAAIDIFEKGGSRAVWNDEQRIIKAMAEKGVKLYLEPTPEEMQAWLKTGEPVVEAWVKANPGIKPLLDILQKYAQ